MIRDLKRTPTPNSLVDGRRAARILGTQALILSATANEEELHRCLRQWRGNMMEYSIKSQVSNKKERNTGTAANPVLDYLNQDEAVSLLAQSPD